VRVSKCLLSFSLFVGVLPLPALAQTPPQSAADASQQPTPVIKVKSTLVILDVVATDKKDHVVQDLKKEDLAVFENGVKQIIRTFESPAAQPPVPAAPMLDRNGYPNWGESPITIIVLDQLNTPLEEIAFAREQLFKYLQAQPAQLAEPTSLIVLNDRGIQDATPATRDRDALLATARREHVGLPFRLNRGAVNEMLSESFAPTTLSPNSRLRSCISGDRAISPCSRGVAGSRPLAPSKRSTRCCCSTRLVSFACSPTGPLPWMLPSLAFAPRAPTLSPANRSPVRSPLWISSVRRAALSPFKARGARALCVPGLRVPHCARMRRVCCT
jgi:hypothetical protein